MRAKSESRLDINVAAGHNVGTSERSGHTGLRRCLGWVLAILAGLASGGQSPAAETLLLQGPNPQVTFDDNDTVLQMWQVFGDDSGFDIIDPTGGTAPFHIVPAALDNSFFLDNAGAVGFGTAMSGASLHVSTAGLQPALRLQTTNIAGARAWDLRGSGGRFDLVDVTNGNATPFGVQAGTPTNTLYLTNSGKAGFGTTTPDANSQVDIRSIQLNGLLMKRAEANQPHYVRVETNTGIFRCGVQGDGNAQFGAITTGKGLNLLAGGTSKIVVDSTGRVSIGNPPPAITTDALIHASGAKLTAGGVWTSVSSRAAKQDIEPITSDEARETVLALQPVGYRYRNELDERYVGFIAEDVPELVATHDRKGLAPMDITAVLTKVVQDQDRMLQEQGRQLAEERQRIEKERQRCDKLEQSVASLMQRLSDLEQQRNGETVPVK